MSRKRKVNPVLQIGQQFYKLTVEEQVLGCISERGLQYVCRCSCSPYKHGKFWSLELLDGSVRDCGCRKKTLARVRRFRARQRKQKMCQAVRVTQSFAELAVSDSLQ